mmetsp:Transcript_9912/g.19222  ORF Transcript_9912/g.19222 Transcript_9912/m.19222 type:complete len:90 (+) Transcript_9912:486-755(+)
MGPKKKKTDRTESESLPRLSSTAVSTGERWRRSRSSVSPKEFLLPCSIDAFSRSSTLVQTSGVQKGRENGSSQQQVGVGVLKGRKFFLL